MLVYTDEYQNIARMKYRHKLQNIWVIKQGKIALIKQKENIIPFTRRTGLWALQNIVLIALFD